jgi:hypothetical protein
VPELIVKATGEREYVTPERLAARLATRLYEQPDGAERVSVEVAPGLVGETSVGELGAVAGAGARPESNASLVARERSARIEREQGGVLGTLATAGETVLDEASFGLYGAAGELVGGDQYTEERLERQEANPVVHGVTKVGTILGTTLASGGTGMIGKVARATPLGAVAARGSRIAALGEGGGALARGGALVAGGVFEGGATGAGQAVQELVATDDELTVERIGSALSSNIGPGMVYGAAGNLAAAGVGKALRKAKGALDNLAAKGTREGVEGGAQVADDLAELGPEDLRKAKKAELERVDLERTTTKQQLTAAKKAELDAIDQGKVTAKADLEVARKAELDAIEAARVPQRTSLVDDLRVHREALTEEKIWLATKDVDAKKVGNVREISKISYDADKSIRSMLNNPKALAERPLKALEALQRQEHALELLARNEDELRRVFAADETGTRAASLDRLGAAVERNRALQARVRELVAPPASPKLAQIADQLESLKTAGRSSAKLDELQAAMDDLATKGRTSKRLDEIAAAQEMLAGGGKKGIGESLVQGSIFSSVTGAVAGLGIPGAGFIAPMLGGKVASAVTERLFGQVGKAAGQVAKRSAAAVDAFLTVGKKVAPAVPVLATKVLSAVRYEEEAPARRPRRGTKVAKDPTLAELYKTRSAEIRNLTAAGPDGRPKLRRDARERIAAMLSPIAAVDPLLADRLEAQEARKLEYLARKLPRRPDTGSLPMGPDTWQPSEFAMRGWARTIAAAEDPIGIVERMADATITPEDAEVMRELFPEQLAALTQDILERLPELQQTLPYERRIAMAILTGVPVDPSMQPRVIARLQATFKREAGTEGGIQGPTPQPQFGSVKNQDETAAQRREGA